MLLLLINNFWSDPTRICGSWGVVEVKTFWSLPRNQVMSTNCSVPLSPVLIWDWGDQNKFYEHVSHPAVHKDVGGHCPHKISCTLIRFLYFSVLNSEGYHLLLYEGYNVLFVLPLPDHTGQLLKDLIPSKSSPPWYEMASQHHGVVIGACGSLHKVGSVQGLIDLPPLHVHWLWGGPGPGESKD